MAGDLVTGEATKGEGFSSSLVYALIKISACGTIVWSSRKKLVRVEILQFDACAVSVYQALFSLSPRRRARFFFGTTFDLENFLDYEFHLLTLYFWCATIRVEMCLRRKTLKAAALEIPGILNTSWMLVYYNQKIEE